MHEDPQRKPGAICKASPFGVCVFRKLQESGKTQEKDKLMSKRMENGTSKESLEGF